MYKDRHFVPQSKKAGVSRLKVRRKYEMNVFEDLDVWKRSCRLTVALYNSLNDCKDRCFKDQMTRAALSIPSNIAEGAERRTKKEFINFLSIAKGSAAELRTQVYIASKIKLISASDCKNFTDELKIISAMLQKLISAQGK